MTEVPALESSSTGSKDKLEARLGEDELGFKVVLSYGMPESTPMAPQHPPHDRLFYVSFP